MDVLTIEKFRANFPEFIEDNFPDSAVKIRLSLAAKFFLRKPGQILKSETMLSDYMLLIF